MQLDERTQVKAGEAESAFKPKTLLSYMKKFPIKRVVHLPNVTADPIKFDLLYNISQDSELPPGAASAQMARFELSGVDSTLAKHNTTGKQHLPRLEASHKQSPLPLCRDIQASISVLLNQ